MNTLESLTVEWLNLKKIKWFYFRWISFIQISRVVEYVPKICCWCCRLLYCDCDHTIWFTLLSAWFNSIFSVFHCSFGFCSFEIFFFFVITFGFLLCEDVSCVCGLGKNIGCICVFVHSFKLIGYGLNQGFSKCLCQPNAIRLISFSFNLFKSFLHQGNFVAFSFFLIWMLSAAVYLLIVESNPNLILT